jgi:hypothetical protein
MAFSQAGVLISQSDSVGLAPNETREIQMAEDLSLAMNYVAISVWPPPGSSFIGRPWDIEIVRQRVVSVDVSLGLSRVVYTVRNNRPETTSFRRFAISVSFLVPP